MTPDEGAQILVTARFLRAAQPIFWLVTGLTLLSAYALIFRTAALAAALTGIALGVVSIVYCIRIAFDAQLFDDVAAGRLTMSELDAALVVWGKKPDATPSWAGRCRGARRLVIICAAVTIAQILTVVLL